MFDENFVLYFLANDVAKARCKAIFAAFGIVLAVECIAAG